MILDQIVNGITLGTVYALIALGFSLIFSILELINFAHGSILMVGSFIGLTVALRSNFLVALLVTAVATGLIGFSVEKMALYPLRIRKGPPAAQFISTIGAGMMIDIAAFLIWGPYTRTFPVPFRVQPLHLGSAQVSPFELAVLVVSLSCMLLLQFLILHTRFGRAMRATVQNPVVAGMMGVNVDLVISSVFALGSALAGIAGILISVYYNCVDLGIGFMAGMKGFTAAVFGGMGSLTGSVIGGLLLGVMESVGATWLSAYKDAIAFAILIVILLVKPNGLLGLKRPVKL
jgi:branched-chain amino acid transport system permease protein